MSITLANAQTYVARAIGGAGDATILARALEAIGGAMEEFQQRNDWSFLRVDTAQTFLVTVSAGSGSTTVASTGTLLKDVLVGMTISGTNIQAGTTVTAVASASSITISLPTTGAISNGQATFGGTIPVIAGTDQYTLPQRFWKPYSCRMVSASKLPLRYIHHSNWDKVAWDETLRGTPTHYTIYNGADFDASGTQQTKIKFFPVPAQADVCLLRYYRPFDISKTTLDILDEYMYTLLNFARVKLLLHKNATDERIPALAQQAEVALRRAIATDRNEGGEDEMEGFHTPTEIGPGIIEVGWPRGDGPWF